MASKPVNSIAFVTRNGRQLSANAPDFGALPTGSFFVRECYVDYYQQMMLWFGYCRIRGVTVSGTSGVGTSVFMAYFFLRHQLEHTNNTFVFISFDKHSVVQQAVVWKNGESTELATANITDVKLQFSDDPNAIFLIDGPPSHRFVTRHRHVVFTSFNAKWLSKVKTHDTERRLYMPLWDVDELTTAVEALDLGNALGRMRELPSFPRDADERYHDEVAYRFDVFGGVARACLETDASRMAAQLQEMQTAAASVDVMTGKVPGHSVNRNAVESIGYSEDLKGKKLHPRLYHWYPSGCSYGLKIASPCVLKLLSARVHDLNDNDKTRFECGANWCPEASALRQAMLKNRLLSLIKEGLHMVANSLDWPAELHEYDLKLRTESNGPVTKLLSSKFGLKDPTGASWFIPQCNALQSIDAFYMIDASVCRYNKEGGMADALEIQNERAGGFWRRHIDAVVFHVMRSDDDPINGNELDELLTQLEFMCVQVPRLALVYVVPAAQADYLPRQFIQGGIRLHNDFPLTIVDGISVEMSDALVAADVHTVGDLRRPSIGETLNPEQLQLYKEAQDLLCQHENNAVVTGSETYNQLQAIPQFVWGV